MRKIHFVFTIILLLSANLTFAESGNTINIAIIADRSSGLDKSALVSLLEVELSQKEGIKLLERAAIDKILEEQKLSAAGLMDRAAAIKIGKLLRADAFIILSLESQTQDANDLIRVRVSETAHGLRLLDYFEQSDKTNPKESVEKIVKKIETVINKINQPDEKLIPIGIVDIHRVQLGEQYKMLERTLPVMLSVRLSLEPQIIMLEREDLKALLDEKLMTEGKDSKFWNSAILIEGYLQPNNGNIEMHLNLKQSGGDNLESLVVPVEPNEPSIAIAKASTEITKQLQDTPTTVQWQSELEAEEFYQQGQMLAAHSRNDEAIPLLETAHSLQHQNVYYTGALFEKIWKIRLGIERILIRNESTRTRREEWQKNNPQSTPRLLKLEEPVTCPYSDIEIVQLVSTLVRQIRDGYEKGQLSTRDIHDKFSRNLGDDPHLTIGYFMNPVSVDTVQIRKINRENRKIWINTYDSALQKQPTNNDYALSNSILRARLAWISSDDPNEVLANVKNAFAEFIMPPELGGRLRSVLQREEVYEQAFGSLEFFSTEELKKLTEVNDIIISSESRKALLSKSYNLNDHLQNTLKESASYQEVQLLLKKLKKLDSFQDIQTKQILITQIRRYIDYIGLPIARSFSLDKTIEIWEEMCNLLIEQKDIMSLAFLNPGSQGHISMPLTPLPNQDIQLYLRYYLILDRIAEVFQPHKSDKKVLAALNNIKDFQAEIKNRFPEINPHREDASGLSVKMLLTKQDWFKDIIKIGSTSIQGGPITWSERSFKAKLKDEYLWVVFQAGGSTGHKNNQGNLEWPADIGFAGINLAQKKVFALWQTEVVSHDAVRQISDLCVTDKASYVSLLNTGILELPGYREGRREYLDTTKIYTQENRLPSVLITSITQDGDKLLIAYGDSGQESGLGLYDPKSEIWKGIFCSTLKGESPFSQGKLYQIDSMLLESPNKLFFSASGNNINQGGLWKLNTDTLDLQYIWSGVTDIYKDMNNDIWLNSTSYKMKLEPDSEKITAIMLPGKKQWYANVIKAISGLDKDLFVPESFLNAVTFGPYYALGNLDLSTSAIHNNKLWARIGKSQIIIAEKGKKFEEAQIIENNILDGQPVEKFVSTLYGLIAIGKGTVGLIETGD